MKFDADERDLLAAWADVLIPASAEMPSASQADAAGRWLDEVLVARPDLATGLKRLLQKTCERDPYNTIADLRARDPAMFEVLAQVVAGAYFMNPDVQKAIGYTGQGPQPIDPRPDYLDDGLLESVIRRGPIYRRTPDERRLAL